MKKLLLTLLLSSSVYSAFAQLHGYKWRLGISTGTTNYYGDIQPFGLESLDDLPNWYKRHQNYAPEWSYQASLEYALSPSTGLMLSAGTYQFGSSDRFVQNDGTYLNPTRNFDRALNFQTRLVDAGLSLVVKPDNNWLLAGKSFFAPYLTFGGGLQHFEVRGDLLDENGNRYLYDTHQPQTDGVFETKLNPLTTERESSYRNLTPYTNFGMGLRVRVTPQVELFAQSTFNYAFTDFLDDVSGRYKVNYQSSFQEYAARPGENRPIREQPYRGNPNGRNDWYIYHGFGIKFSFGAKKQAFNFPTITQRYEVKIKKTEEKTGTENSKDTLGQNETFRINPYYSGIPVPAGKPKKTSLDSTKLKERVDLKIAQDSLIDKRDSISTALNSLQLFEQLILADTLLADSLKQSQRDSLTEKQRQLTNQLQQLDSLKSNNDRLLSNLNLTLDSLSEENPPFLLDYSRLPARVFSLEDSSLAIHSPEMVSRSEMESELNKLRIEMLQTQAKRDSVLILAISSLANPTRPTENQNSGTSELIRETFSEKETRTIETNNLDENSRNRMLRDALLLGGAAAATSAVSSDRRPDSIGVNKEYVVLDSLLLDKIQRDSLLIDSLQNQPVKIDTVVKKMKNIALVNTLIHDSYFEINQEKLSEEEKEKINQFILDLPLQEDFLIQLKGFADHTGTLSYNLKLIEKRVQEVKKFLVDELEINQDRISIQEGGLIQRKSTSGSYDQDRRVEIRVHKN
ncbi:OmpA family protein [Algoriphagus sp.]|uniref:OmpA family protein n=1 Tax=Algoriphagus sp. TaxID=1872435 RepID=UPI002603BDA4|nr:OmpA family protein [Algoriphagus sp.]